MIEKENCSLVKISNALGLYDSYKDYIKKLEDVKNSLFNQILINLGNFEQLYSPLHSEYFYSSTDSFSIILTPEQFSFFNEWKNGAPYVKKN